MEDQAVLKIDNGKIMPGVGLMVRVVGFGSEGPEFKSRSAVELIPSGVNSACHLSEVGKMSVRMLVYCVGVARIVPNNQVDGLSSTNALQRVWSQSPPISSIHPSIHPLGPYSVQSVGAA